MQTCAVKLKKYQYLYSQMAAFFEDEIEGAEKARKSGRAKALSHAYYYMQEVFAEMTDDDEDC